MMLPEESMMALSMVFIILKQGMTEFKIHFKIHFFHNLDYFFVLSSSSKSGSFIRPKKADFGVKCIQAIYEKYCEKVAVTAHQEKHFIFMKNNDILPIDFVGMQKIAAKQRLVNISYDSVLVFLRVSNAELIYVPLATRFC